MKKLLLLPLFFIFSSGMRAQSPDLTNKIDSLIGTVIGKGTPGCVIGVLKDGKVLYKNSYGMANLDHRIPVTDSTVFNLESVSKQFTAFLVLLLEEEGKLNLDDPIHTYIPELKSYGYQVTIRELLHHTSGIPTYDVLQLLSGISDENPWDKEDQLSMLQSYHKLNFKPNDEHLYSNDNYFLLTLIIEKVEEKPFAQCMNERIFVPLKMKTAAIYDSPGKVILNRATGYNTTGGIFTQVNTGGNSTCGYSNIYLSVNDLINWSINMYSRSVGGTQLFDRIFNATDTLNSGEKISYTFGFFTWNPNGPKIAFHEGGGDGFRAYYGYLPEANFSIFILSNNFNTDVMHLESVISDWYNNEHLKPEIKNAHKEITVKKELFEIYKGSYMLPNGMLFTFDKVNDTLKLILPDNSKFALYAEKENEFFVKEFESQFTFVKGGKGKVNELLWNRGYNDIKCIRYSEPKPLTNKEMQSYTGKYVIPGLNVTYPVYLKENELYMTLPKTLRKADIDPIMKLVYRGENKFSGNLGMIEFTRNKAGKIGGFFIADVGRVRNIEFTKTE